MSDLIRTLPTSDLRAAVVGGLPATKRDGLALMRMLDRGGLSLTAALERCQAATADRQAMRRTRATRHIAAGLGFCPIDPSRHRGHTSNHPLAAGTGQRDFTAAAWRAPTTGTQSTRPRAGLPRGTPAARLDAKRRQRIAAQYAAIYRTATHGDLTAATTRDPAAVGVRQTESNDWNGYSKSTKYPMRLQDTHITAPADWRARVQRRGLAVIDGMLTLDAAPLAAPDGVDLYAATWLVQGRGTTTTAARGYIARGGGMSYHADTAAAALAGLGRKIKRQKLDAEFATLIASANLPDLAARAPAGAVVRIADARAVGACEYGIASWCNATGLPYAQGAAPLADVLAAWQREPRNEARAAILHALRRYRAHMAAAPASMAA